MADKPEYRKMRAPVGAVMRPQAEYIVSAAHYSQFPGPQGIEYCVMGRSNVGKSSFINHVLENQRLAKVSKTPGKTSLANFFRVNETTVWVDLPGYGYARTSRSEKVRWSELISDYCTKRANLAGVIWLVDVRHPGAVADVEAYAWLSSLGHRVLPVFTKCDKLAKSGLKRNLGEMSRLFGFGGRGVSYSTHEHASRERFWEAYLEWTESREGAGLPG